MTFCSARILAAAPLTAEQHARLAERDQINEKADLLLAEGKLSEAIVNWEKMLGIEREVLDEDHRDLINSVQTLVRLTTIKGDFAAARNWANTNLEMQKKGRADDHWRVASAGLALAFVDQCSKLAAEDLERLRRAEQINAQAVALLNSEKPKDGALPLLNEALQINKDVLGEESVLHLMTLNNLGWCLRSLEQFDKAEPVLKKLVELRKKVVGVDHPDYALAHNNLGWVYSGLKQYERAESLFREAANIYERAEGKFGADYAQALENLSSTYFQMGNYRRAEALRQEVVAIRKATLGDKSSKYAEALRSLALVYQRLGEYDKEEPLISEALEVFRQLKGDQDSNYLTCLNNLAYVYQHQGKAEKALPLQLQLLDTRRKKLGDNDVAVGIMMHRVSSIYIELKNYSQALDYDRQGLEVFRKSVGEKHANYTTGLSNLAWILEQLADEARDQEKFAEAQNFATEALAFKQKLFQGDHHELVNLRLLIQYDDQRSKMTADQRRELKEATDLLGQAYKLTQTKPRDALLLAERAVELRRKQLTEQHFVTLEALTHASFLYKDTADYERALPAQQKVLELTEKLRGPQHPHYIIALHNLAAIHELMGDFSQALATYEQARAAYVKVFGEKNNYYATTLNSLAIVNEQLGNHSNAESLYLQALAIRREIFNAKGQEYAHSVLNLGFFYMTSLGDYDKAEPLLKQALDLYQQSVGEKHPYYARALDFLAGLYADTDRYELSESLYQQALALRKEAPGENTPEYALSLQNLAAMHQANEQYDKAEPLLLKSLEIERGLNREKHPRAAYALNHLANVYTATGRFAEAHAVLLRSLEIRQQAFGKHNPHYAESVCRVGVSHALLAQPEQGLPLAVEALRMTRGFMERSAAFQSERQQLGMRHSLWSFLDRYLYVASRAKTPPEEMYVEVLAWKGAVAARLGHLRRLHHRLRESGNPAAVKLETELDDAVRVLATLTQKPADADRERVFRVEALSEKVENLQKELAKHSVELQKEQAEQQRTPDEVRDALPEGAVLIDLLSCEQYGGTRQGEKFIRESAILTAFVVRRDRPTERIEIGPVEPIEKAIASWRQRFGQKSAESDPGAELHNLVWRPLAKSCANAKLLLISPNALTAPLPWGALPGSKPGTYLIEEFAIATVPIPRMLPELLAETASAASQGDAGSLLLVGDVDFGGDPGVSLLANAGARAPRGDQPAKWAPLPGTREEVSAIKAAFETRFGKAKPVELTGLRATKPAVREHVGKYEYLHFSTHGFFAPPKVRSAVPGAADVGPSAIAPQASGSPDAAGFHPGLLSGLVLTGANRPPAAGHDDGILTALEVAEMDLSHVRLATLSACETGLGQTAGGEGLLGLQRAFQSAGAKTVVAGLWKVPDKATQLLMTRFYQNLWQSKMSKLDALREAQLWMIREAPKQPDILRGLDVIPDSQEQASTDGSLPPYYWAAFVLSGDWR